MKMNSFLGDLTDVSAIKEALLGTAENSVSSPPKKGIIIQVCLDNSDTNNSDSAGSCQRQCSFFQN